VVDSIILSLPVSYNCQSVNSSIERRIAEMLVLLTIHRDQVLTGDADPYAWALAKQKHASYGVRTKYAGGLVGRRVAALGNPTLG